MDVGEVMKAQHTPGPWTWGKQCRFTHQYSVFGPRSADGSTYAPLAKLDKEADARLIAAAPDLLLSARALLDAIGMFGPKGGPISIARDATLAAIARAEGRS